MKVRSQADAEGLSVHPLIEEKSSEIGELRLRYQVRRLEVFGSAALGVHFDPARSDADFLVEFEPETDLPALEQFFGLHEKLCQLLGRPVDLVEARAVRNPYVLESINRSREVVYAA